MYSLLWTTHRVGGTAGWKVKTIYRSHTARAVEKEWDLRFSLLGCTKLINNHATSKFWTWSGWKMYVKCCLWLGKCTKPGGLAAYAYFDALTLEPAHKWWVKCAGNTAKLQNIHVNTKLTRFQTSSVKSPLGHFLSAQHARTIGWLCIRPYRPQEKVLIFPLAIRCFLS